MDDFEWTPLQAWCWLAFLAVGGYECWLHGINVDLALFLFLCAATVFVGVRYIIANKRQ